MIDTRVIKDIAGKVDLCETFTDDETKVLKQVETGIVYDSSVIDVIEGFKDGKPYSRFSYVEADRPVQEWEEHEVEEMDAWR